MAEFDAISYSKASGNTRNLAEMLKQTKEYEGRKYQIINPYRNGGSLALKGQLHAHTTGSDGTDTPETLVTAYKNAGYDFIAITDHDVITPDPGVAGITFITGVEETDWRHVTAYDVTECLKTFSDAQLAFDFHRARNKLCSFAHPGLSKPEDRLYSATKNETAKYYDYNFMEIWNSYRAFEDHVDYALSAGKKVFTIAVDDTHVVADHLNRGWVVVYANANEKEAILQSLREGNFYASSGNDISISVENNVITASSTSASNISFIGFNGRVLQTNNGVTTATYTVKGNEVYVRTKSVKVSDSTIAWGQPIFIDVEGGDTRQGSELYEQLYEAENYIMRGIDAVQSIPNAISTLVVLNTIIKDSRFVSYSPEGSIKPSKSGAYEVIASVQFHYNGTGVRRVEVGNITKNIWRRCQHLPIATEYLIVNFTTILEADANDRIGLRVYQNSGGDLNVVPDHTHMIIRKIA